MHNAFGIDRSAHPSPRRLAGALLTGVAVSSLVLAQAGASFAATPSVTAAGSSPRVYAPSRVDAPDPQLKGRWGERVASTALPGPKGGAPVTAGDLDGDGVNDYFVGDPNFAAPAVGTAPALATAGRVYAVSGKTNAILYSIDSPEPQAGAHFGFFISVPGDVNGDGKPDIAIGTDAQSVFVGRDATGTATTVPCGAPEPNGCNEGQGKAWVFSGAITPTGNRLLTTLDNPNPQGSAANSARFGARIGRAGDLNGDGKPDIIVGASNNDVCSPTCTPTPPAGVGCGDVTPLPSGCRINQGQAFVFNGASGALLRTLDLPDADQPIGTCSKSCGSFGLAVQSPGDVNGDGTPDLLIDAGSYSFDTATAGGAGTAGSACQGATPTAACNVGQGRMYLFNGKTGTVFARIDDPTPQAGAVFGFQDVAPLSPGDVNNDGSSDIYANGFSQDGPAGAGEGGAWVFDGKAAAATGKGQVLYKLTSPAPEVGGQFGFGMATTDFNGDGSPDMYVGSSPHHVAGSTGTGVTAVFSGKDGSLLKSLTLPSADVQPSTATDLGPNIGWAVAAPGDLNSDGLPDYVAGAPFLNVGANQDQGAVYNFRSAAVPVTVTRLAGTNRITTAVAVSQHSFPTTGSAKSIALTRADLYPDALAGAPLAAAKGGPVLLTHTAALDSVTRTEISRALPAGGTVYLLGGTTALSPAIQSGLTSMGYKTVRVAGTTRFSTAVAIANALGNPGQIFEVTGINFPDAISVGPAAIATRGAILLTNGAKQASPTAAYLAAHPTATRVAVGGPAASADPAATPVAGIDRFATSADVAIKYFPGPTVAGLATGQNFPDALVGGPALGSAGPMLLVQPTAPLPAPIKAYLSGKGLSLTTFLVFGGTQAVADNVIAAAQAAAGGK